MNVQEITNSIADEIINFPPRTAVISYHFALDCANRYRRAASLAADNGDRQQAIDLTARAQKCDDAARTWKDAVPEWQWDLYYKA